MDPALERLRLEVPAVRGRHLLSYAATAPLPEPAAAAMARVAREGLEPLSEHAEAWLSLVETARRRAAEAVGALPGEIAFASGTSAALSLAAASVRWRRGDRILFPADEFPSNRYAWQALADLGVRAEPLPAGPGAPLAGLLERADLAGVRLVAFSAVSYRDGRREDVARAAALCRERGILTAVDAVQAVGAVPVDVRAWGCDLLACGGQKWLLGPVGSGFLFVRRDILESLRAGAAGWASARSFGDLEAERFVPCDGARRLEPGLPDVAAIAGLSESLRLLAEAGWGRIFARIAASAAAVRAGLEARGLEPLAAAGSGIVSVALDPDDLASVEAACRRRRVSVTCRGGILRASPHAVASDGDVAELLDALDEALPFRRRAGIASPGAFPAPPAADAPPGAAARPLALVTGASGGLGEGIAEALARRGCDLLLAGRSAGRLAALARRLSGRHGIGAAAAPVDLSDAEEAQRWIRRSRAALSRIEILANVAASADAALFLETGVREEARSMQANVLSPMALARAALPGMVARGRGRILNVVAAGGRNALPLLSGYAASKGALWAWSESLGRELSGTGVSVTTFLPPHMPTSTQRDLARKALGYFARTGKGEGSEPPRAVAESAVEALLAGRPFSGSLGARLRTAMNALLPAWMGRRIRRRWRGTACVRSAAAAIISCNDNPFHADSRREAPGPVRLEGREGGRVPDDPADPPRTYAGGAPGRGGSLDRPAAGPRRASDRGLPGGGEGDPGRVSAQEGGGDGRRPGGAAYPHPPGPDPVAGGSRLRQAGSEPPSGGPGCGGREDPGRAPQDGVQSGLEWI